MARQLQLLSFRLDPARLSHFLLILVTIVALLLALSVAMPESGTDQQPPPAPVSD